jgi:hypothetical protein
MLQFGASLADDSRVVIYDRNMFIVQATGQKYAALNGAASHRQGQSCQLHLCVSTCEKKEIVK